MLIELISIVLIGITIEKFAKTRKQPLRVKDFQFDLYERHIIDFK